MPPLHLAAWDGGSPLLATAVRLARAGDDLAVRFDAAYDALHVDESLPRDGDAEGLWEHDVVELFASDRDQGVPYRELEASPLGQWLSLAFDAPRVRSTREPRARPLVEATIAPDRFTVTLAVPLRALATGGGGLPCRLRLGLFRIHGPGPGRGTSPARAHQAWPPVPGPRPDFHRPERWATVEVPG